MSMLKSKLAQGGLLAVVVAVLLTGISPQLFRDEAFDRALESVAERASDFWFTPACAGVANTNDLILNRGGQYYCVSNTTVNSGVNLANSGTYASTVGAGQWQNPASSTKTIVPDHVRINLTGVAPVSTSGVQYLFEVDSGARLPTANALTQTPVNLNPFSTTASVASVKWHSGGAMSLPTATAASRLTGTGFLEFMLAVTGDEYELQFGCTNDGNSIGPSAANRTTSSTGGRFVTCTPGTVIPPGWTGTLHIWLPGAATNVPAFEYRACWYEE